MENRTSVIIAGEDVLAYDPTSECGPIEKSQFKVIVPNDHPSTLFFEFGEKHGFAISREKGKEILQFILKISEI